MALFRRTKPTPANPAPPAFASDETFGIPSVVAAQSAAARGDLPGVVAAYGQAAGLADAATTVRVVAEAAPLSTLADWSADHPSDPLASTLYGTALITAGWAVRGGGRAHTVSGVSFNTFWDHLAEAEKQLEIASGGWAGAPIAWCGLVIASRGLQRGAAEIEQRYEGGVRSGGESFLHLYEQTLQGLCKKWSGSHEQMFAFARSHADPSAPLATNALPAIGHLEVWADDDDPESRGAYMRRADVRGDIEGLAGSSWMPGFPTDSAGLDAHNVFAVSLYLTGNKEAAAQHVDYLGDRIGLFPWIYLGRRANVLAELRGLTPA